MSVNGKFADISREDLTVVADEFGIGTAETVLEQVSGAIAAWPEFAGQAKVSAAEVKRVRAHHQKRQ
jgi:serine/threonine-protein kinase HipA